MSNMEDDISSSLLPAPTPTLLLQSMTFDYVNTSILDPQLLSEFLMEIGACSTSVIDCDKGNDNENPMFHEPTLSTNNNNNIEMITTNVASSSWLNFSWNLCNVTAHFPSTFNLDTIVTQVRATFDLDDDGDNNDLHYVIDNVPSLDWVSHVQSSWKPQYIRKCKFVLRFPWHTNNDVQEVIQKSENNHDDDLDDNNDIIELKLQGGSAFGTGEHPTTQLCLSWIRSIITNNNNDNNVKNFLDYGAGSGVLGLAASALSNNITSIGIDIDLDAVLVADDNAKINNLTMKSYLPPISTFDNNDIESMSVLIKSQQRMINDDDDDNTIYLPDEWNGQIYDACVANILAGPLISLSSTISGYVKSGGFIGISGVLEYQSNDVINAFIDYFDDLKVDNVDDGWVLITGRKK